MAKAKKDNEYDERRETLVMEQKTTWPPDLPVPETERRRVAEALHNNPKDAKRMQYILCPTGLIRHVTVTPEDLERLEVSKSDH